MLGRSASKLSVMKTAKSRKRSIEEIIWAAHWITHLKVLKYVEDNSCMINPVNKAIAGIFYLIYFQYFNISIVLKFLLQFSKTNAKKCAKLKAS